MIKISIEIITLITGSVILGTLTGIYLYHRLKRLKIRKFIIKGNKEIKRLHHVLKTNKFQIIDVNKNFRYKVLINNNETRFSFSIVAIVKRKNKKYLCFLNPEDGKNIDYELLFKTMILKHDRGLIIYPETFKLYEFRIKR